ncbi:TSUP family transporter [Caulobacter segnis]
MVHLDVLASLFVVAALAGALDAIAGGGGLVTLPALLLAGLSPVQALGTNKLQGAISAISSTSAFARRGLIDLEDRPAGRRRGRGRGLCGALCASLLVAAAAARSCPCCDRHRPLFRLFARVEDRGRRPRMALVPFACFVAPLVSFYDGIFGPSAGAFYMVAIVTLLGCTAFAEPAAHTKLANAASSLGSLFLFILKGAVVWPMGLAMAAGAFIGHGRVEARHALRPSADLGRCWW